MNVLIIISTDLLGKSVLPIPEIPEVNRRRGPDSQSGDHEEHCKGPIKLGAMSEAC